MTLSDAAEEFLASDRGLDVESLREYVRRIASSMDSLHDKTQRGMEELRQVALAEIERHEAILLKKQRQLDHLLLGKQ